MESQEDNGSNRRHDRYNRFIVKKDLGPHVSMLLMNWKVPREENNRGKRGRPFKSTSTLITFLAKLMSMHSDPSRYTGGDCSQGPISQCHERDDTCILNFAAHPDDCKVVSALIKAT